MQLSELYEKIDARYPKKLSDDYIAAYGGHDNSGILIDCAGEVTGGSVLARFFHGRHRGGGEGRV